MSLVVTPGCSFPTSWRSGMLGACVMRLWSHVVAPVFCALLCLGGCISRCCFHIVFDSAGSAGVVIGPTLVVGRGFALFRCFVVLCSRVVCFRFVGVLAALAARGSSSRELGVGRVAEAAVVPSVVNSRTLGQDRGASSPWPSEERKVGTPSSSAKRGNVTDMIITLLGHRSQQSQIARLQRQRGGGDIREPLEDPQSPGCGERSVHSSSLAIAMGPTVLPRSQSAPRPTHRPVSPSQVPISPIPISTPISPPTPLPTPAPTPPSVYPPYVQPTPSAQSESISRSEMEVLIRKLLAESLSLSKPHSLQNYYKLPNAYFPPGFKASKYRKYDRITDPQFHLAGFTMDSHRWLYDWVLLVYLFQQSLEGEALRWFTALPALDLINFDIVSERFISHFSYMATQVPTLPDLVAEKMKPDEDFVTFANRWRSMASRADVPIPESQAITIIVTNTIPLLRSILMLSEFPSFAHLYNRAMVVQNQIKDSSLPPSFKGKPKGRKAPAAPTTEGVTVNESFNACSQPLRPPNKSSNPHQFPSHPSKTYSAVPPPSGYTHPGPKRSHYPPLPETLEDIFFALMFCDAIWLPLQRESVNPRVDTSKYCPYHRAHGHELHNCFTFYD
ncbi:hypothetical protein Taro_030118 [Colocasia esculenta]|uniref:Retrotransposon gag domain-containing protein n=1 Tax=Colocasia esculenta TaxID=4460 RepID=A0A843VT70_COLES|nr:hypothetical protein [Colocasia esculenta]